MKTNRLVRLSLALLGAGLSASLAAQITTVSSAPVGVISEQISRAESGLAFPLIARDVFVATATGNTGAVLSFPADHGDIGARLAAGGRYYVEVLTGPFEGERLDVDTAATKASATSSVTLSLGSGSHSTLSTIAGGALAETRCAVRPHVTLASLQTMFTPALRGNKSASQADGVRIYGAEGFDSYYLLGDGATWRKSGESADMRHHVIPPDASVILELKSGEKRWVQAGRVRTNVFRKNLAAGVQSFATGFPLDLSPVDVGAFVDTSVPVAERWTGNDVLASADQFRVYFDKISTPHAVYYLRGDGTSWRSATSSTNYATTSILGATQMTLLRRVNADSAYFILPPFELP